MTTSAHLSDRNFSSLEKEAEKLDEHSKKAWKCWMWIMIGLVMVIFICKYNILLNAGRVILMVFFIIAVMVLFMKIMKKRT